MLPPTQSVRAKQPDEPLSPFKFAKKVEKVVDDYIRPLLQKDGGDLELLDIKDTIVFFEMQGACAGCTGADQTVKQVVEKTLKDRVDIRIRVVVA
jgi:Fe-S cluster biogenesis protein NfuA